MKLFRMTITCPVGKKWDEWREEDYNKLLKVKIGTTLHTKKLDQNGSPTAFGTCTLTSFDYEGDPVFTLSNNENEQHKHNIPVKKMLKEWFID